MDYVKNSARYTSRAMFIVSAVLIVITVARVSGYMTSSGQITKMVEAAKAQSVHDEETARILLAKGYQAAEHLKKQNMFVTSPPEPKPPVCLGILGSSVIINGKQYKAGDNVGGAEIISVGTKDVLIKWQDSEITLAPFAVDSTPLPGRKPPYSSADKSKSEPGYQGNKQSKTKKNKSQNKTPELKDDKPSRDKSKQKSSKPSGGDFSPPGDKKLQSKLRQKTDSQQKKLQNIKPKTLKKTTRKK